MAKPPGRPLDVVEVLRLYKLKEGYSDATIADALSIFGWTWQETHVTALLAGRLKPTADEVVFLNNFFIGQYVSYCRS